MVVQTLPAPEPQGTRRGHPGAPGVDQGGLAQPRLPGHEPHLPLPLLRPHPPPLHLRQRRLTPHQRPRGRRGLGRPEPGQVRRRHRHHPLHRADEAIAPPRHGLNELGRLPRLAQDAPQLAQTDGTAWPRSPLRRATRPAARRPWTRAARRAAANSAARRSFWAAGRSAVGAAPQAGVPGLQPKWAKVPFGLVGHTRLLWGAWGRAWGQHTGSWGARGGKRHYREIIGLL